jgi:hypothetical protein
VVEAAAAAAGRLARHCEVIYDRVVGPWFLLTFLSQVGLDHVHYALLLPSLEVCLQRIRSRQEHGFTDLDAAVPMWREFLNAPVDSRHLLSEIVPAAELARQITERTTSAAIRYPTAPSDSSAR